MEQTTQPHKKRALVGILTGATALFLLLTAFTAKNGSDKSSVATNGETLHRESTVTRGDLTVGVTESITAALKVHNISFDFTLTSSSGSGNQNASTAIGIEEVYVKAGQRVKAGDPLVLLFSGDIQEAINQLQSDYQEAVVSLTEAQLPLQKGRLDAKYTSAPALQSGAGRRRALPRPAGVRGNRQHQPVRGRL